MKLSGPKGILSGTLKLPVPLRSIEEVGKIDLWSGFVFCFVYNQYFLNLLLWRHYRDEEQIWRTGKWVEFGMDGEIHKESINIYTENKKKVQKE